MLRAKEVSARLGITDPVVLALIANGEIEAYNISSGLKPHWRIPEAGLNRFLAVRRNALRRER